MKPAESFLDQPVRSLQTMLRTIASVDPAQINVMPDGIYGPQTAAAVSGFQRRQGLNATGITDQLTWERIVSEYELAAIEAGKAQPIQVSLDAGQVLRRGEAHHLLYLVQAMLKVLSMAQTGIPAPGFTGVLDTATQESVSAFQTYAGLPPTGEIDKRTWKNLALHYALAADWLENRGEI